MGSTIQPRVKKIGVRCFIAVDFDDLELLDALGRFQTILVGSGADLKCVERENIHLTLRFLGDVREGLVEELKGIVSQVKFSPFSAELRGVGVFPNLRRPRVVWTGITRGADELKGFFQRLEPEIVGLGFKPERRGFSPHITLARVRSGRNRDRLAEVVTSHAEERFGEFTISHLKLKRSVLTPRGPIYSTLAESTPREI